MKGLINTSAIALALAFTPVATVSVAAQSKSAQSNSAPVTRPQAFSPIGTISVDPAAGITVYDFDVSDIFSIDEFGDPINEVYTINIGANAEVTGIGWDVTQFADTPSWLSEMGVYFGSTSTTFLLSLTPGIGDDFPGTASYSSGGIVDLVGLGLNFTVDADGLLRLEFAESFDDFIDDWDGIWEDGTLSIQVGRDMGMVPEPATWAMMIAGFGLVGFAARRRRHMIAQA